MSRSEQIIVDGTPITICFQSDEKDYISLTDMVRQKGSGDFFVSDWLRNRNTLEYIGEWEQLYNPLFNYGEFAVIKSSAGLNSFKVSVKELVSRTHVISLVARTGRYGGTYAHKDVAFHFAMWISPRFQLYVVKEYEALKARFHQQLGWDVRRELSKLNYHIHTDAIKTHLLPIHLTASQTNIVYAEEADVLNMALFGMTAKEWRVQHPTLKGNLRDYATLDELVCLTNLENLNALFIEQGLVQSERLVRLNEIAIHQMSVLTQSNKRLNQ